MTERLPPVPEPLTPEERALAARLARLGPHGEPSPGLDARILAAARDGLPTRADPVRKRARWPFAFGIAASVALAVGLAWQLRPLPEAITYDEAASAPGVAASASAEMPATDAVAADTEAPATAVMPAEPARPPSAFQRWAAPEPAPASEKASPADAPSDNAASQARKARAPVMPMPMPPPPPAPVVLQAPAVEADAVPLPAPPPPAPAAPQAATVSAPTVAPSAQAVAREATARRARATAEAEAHEAEARAAEMRAAEAAGQDSFADEPFVEDIPPATADSPAVRDAWLHRIRELQAAGDTGEARASLEEFVRRYPTFPLPEDLRPLLD